MHSSFILIFMMEWISFPLELFSSSTLASSMFSRMDVPELRWHILWPHVLYLLIFTYLWVYNMIVFLNSVAFVFSLSVYHYYINFNSFFPSVVSFIKANDMCLIYLWQDLHFASSIFLHIWIYSSHIFYLGDSIFYIIQWNISR